MSTTSREHVNTVELVGRLGQAPELKRTEDGNPYIRLSIATSERFTDRGGEIRERTEWHNGVAWGKAAEEIAGQFQDIDRLMAMTARKMKDGDYGGVWKHYEDIQTAKIQLGNLIRKQLEFDAVPLTLDPVNLGEFKSVVCKSV